MNTGEIEHALRAKYEPKSYALLWEVGNGTGTACSRHADALAMSLWPSRGLELTGIEIKVSRTDWKKELDNPAKAEAICKFCDRWFLAVGDEKIVQAGELPPTWGLMIPDGKGFLKIKTPAPQLEPLPVTRAFMAAVMRRVSEQAADQADIRKAKEGEYARGVKDGKFEMAYVERNFQSLQLKMRTFETASGVDLGEAWSVNKAEKIGHAVAAVLRGEHKQNLDNVIRIQQTASRILHSIATSGIVDDPSI